MLEQQNGRCAICYGIADPSGKRLCVDHDHETGKIRGLLCGPCNWAVGLVKEDVVIARRLIRYLARHGTRSTQGRLTAGQPEHGRHPVQ